MPTVDPNDIEIYYEERGRGDPALLLMGLGADGALAAEHVGAYQDHFRCIVVDARGTGRSAKPDGPYSVPMMARDTAAVIDALRLPPAHVLGISLGGCIAQELALTRPEQVRSLTLVSSFAKADAYTARVVAALEGAARRLPSTDFIRLMQLWLFSPAYHENHMDDLLRREAQAKAHRYPTPLHALLAQCEACLAHDTLDRLGAVRAPTLVTAGDADAITPVHCAQKLVHEIPNAHLTVFAGAGHCHHWERLDEFNAKTVAFMKAH